MGQYINEINGKHVGTSFSEKCSAIEEAGGTKTAGVLYTEDMVIVVDNGPFAAAGYAYSKQEFDMFKSGMAGRHHQWYILPNAESYVD